MARPEALAGARAGAVAEGADAAETDALAATAAALADAREAEPACAERLADVVAPHVAARRERIVAERVVAAPGCRRRVRIAARTGVEQTDHAELGCVAERCLACDVRVSVVRRALNAVAVARELGVGVAHRTLFTLGARARAALLVVGVVVGDLLRLLLLHLLLGRRLQVLLDEVLLIRRDPVLVRAAERRHEERHRREQARVHGQRQARVEQPLRVDLEVPGDHASSVARSDLEDQTAQLDLRLRAGRQRELMRARELRTRLGPTLLDRLLHRHLGLAGDLDRARRALREHDAHRPAAIGEHDRRARGAELLGRE